MFKSIVRVVQAQATEEGEGFWVNRPFPSEQLQFFDPFLMLDEMGPTFLKPGEAKGAPDHPHRGFETVTYFLSGEFEHRDSEGHHGVLRPGDVQWMTAGSGIIHSEMPSAAFRASGGWMHGFQLWVNLPRVDKMMSPRYQDIPAAKIPELTVSDDRGASIRARVIAGRFQGAEAKIDTRIPIEYMDFELGPGALLVHEVPEGFNSWVYVYEGEVLIGVNDQSIPRGNAVFFDQNPGAIRIQNSSSGVVRLIYLAGLPIGEPIVQAGPFVMNTEVELDQAIEEFENGTLIKTRKE